MAYGETYEQFIEKFNNPRIKKTSDECYTPQPIFEVIESWVRENARCDIKNLITKRPFYPNGNYENEDYSGYVVIDNPPFSCITKITDFYTKRNIPFFLFAPTITSGTILKKDGVHSCHPKSCYYLYQ